MKTKRAAVLCCAGAAAAIILSIAILPFPSSLLGIALVLWLSAASYIDLKEFLLLDIFTLPLALAGLGLSYFGFGPSLLNAAAGAALGYLVLWALAVVYQKLRGYEGLGMGDAKLLCAAGAWCGATGLPTVLLIGSMTALIAVAIAKILGADVRGRSQVPFGPFLSIGLFLTWLLQELQQLARF